MSNMDYTGIEVRLEVKVYAVQKVDIKTFTFTDQNVPAGLKQITNEKQVGSLNVTVTDRDQAYETGQAVASLMYVAIRDEEGDGE